MNVMHLNHSETVLSTLQYVGEKKSSTKLVPGAKTVGDRYSKILGPSLKSVKRLAAFLCATALSVISMLNYEDRGLEIEIMQG